MAVPSSRTVNYDSVLSSCLEAYLGKDPQDNIFKDHVLLEVMKQKGMIKMQDGGERIRQPLIYSKNSTVGSYTSYDVLDVTPQDEFTTAFYTWRQNAAAISISGLEEAQNKGEYAIFNLLQGKVDSTLQSLREDINYQLLGKTVASGVWSAGQGKTASTTGTDIDPIPAALSRDPTQSVAIGNINKNTYSWWRAIAGDLDSDVVGDHNSNFANDVTTWAELMYYLEKMYQWCSRGGGGRPDVIICSQAGYEQVMAAMRDKTRYMQQAEGTVAFDNIMFKAGCPIYWDEMMPDISGGYVYSSSSYSRETFYFLNTNFMKFVIESDHNFKVTDFIKPENQDAKTATILLYANIAFSQLRKHGVCYGLDPSVAS